MRLCLLGSCLLAAACSSGGRSDGSAVHASATIGEQGGELAVDSGRLTGLRLRVPPGALAAPTLLSVRDVPIVQTPGTAVTDGAPVGWSFALHPPGLRFEQMATLRAPYLPVNVRETGPGNVRVREVRSTLNVIEHSPQVVDVVGGYVEVPVRWCSQYAVVRGPVTAGIAAYQPPAGTITLDGGLTFTAEPVPPQSPFAAEGAMSWRLTGSDRDDVLYFVGEQIVGRESLLDSWRERWDQPQTAWVPTPGAGTTLTMQVERPIGALAIGGAMTLAAEWTWGHPRFVVGQMLYDLVELRLRLAWNRHDLGVGQRDYVFRFAPGIGLVGMVQDGVAHERQAF